MLSIMPMTKTYSRDPRSSTESEDKRRNDEEAAIIKTACTDPSAFTPLYEHYFQPVYLYCLRRTSTREDAEDITADVFAKCLAGLGGYRGGSVPAWIFTIAHNTLASHYKAHARPQEQTVSLQDISGEDGNKGHTISSELTTAQDSVVEQVIHNDDLATISHLIDNLNPFQKELLSLRLAAGLSARDAGLVLGKSEVATRVAFYRVIEALRRGYNNNNRS